MLTIEEGVPRLRLLSFLLIDGEWRASVSPTQHARLTHCDGQQAEILFLDSDAHVRGILACHDSGASITVIPDAERRAA